MNDKSFVLVELPEAEIVRGICDSVRKFTL
jgi:hypothetical protein